MVGRKHVISKYILLLFAGVLCFLLCSCNPILSLNPKYSYSSFQLELGEKISDDIAEYVDMSQLSDEDAKFVRENTSILYDGKDIKDSDLAEAGGHTLTINYCGHQYRQYTIEIYDHEPPVFTKSKSVYTFATLPLPEEEFDNLFEAEDNSGKVDIEYDVPDVDFNTPGEYKIIAVATDPSGNKAESEASIYVQEPSYGAVGTYVYVSIPDQHLTYFKDSKPVLDCPVVTGNAYGHSTPTGTYTLNYKARNIILKGREDNGTEYQSFVSYWMAFIGSSYGLHDATWRTNFGGNIYQGSGSHGCVNMPYASAAELYEMIEPGVPVLIY